MSKIKLATVWLDGCSGCHMSLLDIDEQIALVAQRADIVYGPLVEGAVANQDDLKLAHTIRARSRIVVSLGDCAVTGNVPAMRNNIPVKQLLERVYIDGVTANGVVPTDGVPALLRRALPLHEVVAVDLHVPGCPPSAAAILHVVSELLDGRRPEVTSRAKFG